MSLTETGLQPGLQPYLQNMRNKVTGERQNKYAYMHAETRRYCNQHELALPAVYSQGMYGDMCGWSLKAVEILFGRSRVFGPGLQNRDESFAAAGTMHES